ncbi:MAG: GspH/FimT family pseudopilin [Rudaea sp.]
MRTSPKSLQRGITLVELIFAIAIAAMLCAVAMPSMSRLLQSSRSCSAHNALVAALNLARSVAVSRQSDVVVCPSIDQSHCENTILWQHGWIVFQDADGDTTRDPDEALISVAQSQTGMAIASSRGRRHVTYRYDGSATGSNLTFTLCDRRGASEASTIVISNAGRVRDGKASASQAAAACAAL